MTKGTLELLPGCASIVLERVVGLQSFVFHDPDLKDDASLTGALSELYTTISNLTQWADAVIVSGESSKRGQPPRKLREMGLGWRGAC